MHARPPQVKKEDANLLQGFDIDEEHLELLPGQFKAVLKKESVRVLDLFRQFDDDASGSISRAEFRKAMGELGIEIGPRMHPHLPLTSRVHACASVTHRRARPQDWAARHPFGGGAHKGGRQGPLPGATSRPSMPFHDLPRPPMTSHALPRPAMTSHDLP